MSKIIALSGFKQSGKDTTAEYLVKEHNFIQYSFAKTLKDMVSSTYNIPRSWCDSSEHKEKPLLEYQVRATDSFCSTIHELLKNEFRELKVEDGDEVHFIKCHTPRSLLILEGSVKRSTNPNFWVNKVIENIKDQELIGGFYSEVNYVISDLRYINEAETLKKAFGKDLITVRINRFDKVDTTDPSETNLIDYKFDKVLDNKGSLQDLYKQVDKLIKGV